MPFRSKFLNDFYMVLIRLNHVPVFCVGWYVYMHKQSGTKYLQYDQSLIVRLGKISTLYIIYNYISIIK